MLGGAAILFLLVLGLLLLVCLAPGSLGRVAPKVWIIGGGLVLPIPVLTALLFYALVQGEYLLAGAGASDEVVRVEAHASRWQWQFRYPDQSGARETVDVLHIPAGQVVEVIVTSADVVHSFWVPRLGGKIDAVPGHVTRLRISADRPGQFGGVCAEYCGTGHTGMRFKVEAHAPDVYPQVLMTGAGQ